ncbi:hypothetical protein STIAU_3719 [Stigmatella aurantiaca DW4/3-1]|uniref:Uncharacterized protein n=1 Tax=Stigmatella aurantiaca (strain DW4/3-1) TaxID=378806 RepID=Q09CC0_STIAD|nr:hypothetical protein STIAU_3719 [Stigmatella aurantiaca DW4/3-1]
MRGSGEGRRRIGRIPWRSLAAEWNRSQREPLTTGEGRLRGGRRSRIAPGEVREQGHSTTDSHRSRAVAVRRILGSVWALSVSAQRLRRHGGHELRLAALDFQHHRLLLGVPLGVEGDLPRHAREVLRRGDGVPERRSGQVGRPLHRLICHRGRVVGQRRHAVRHAAVGLLVLLDERLEHRVRVVHGVVVGEVAAFQRRAPEFEQLLGLPAVPAQQGHLHAQLPRLPRDDAHVRVVPRHEHPLGLRPLDGRQLGPEVRVSLGVALVAGDLPAHLLELLGEHLGQADGVGALVVREDGHLGQLQVLPGELRHYQALERIDEAHAEDVVALPGHLGRRRGVGDHRHLGRLGLLRHRQGHGGRCLADDERHLVLGDEAGDGLGRLLGLALAVVHLQRQLLASHPSRRVRLLDGQLDAVAGGDAERGLIAGQAADLADEDGVLAGRRARRGLGHWTGRRGGRGGLALFLACDGREDKGGEKQRKATAHGRSSSEGGAPLHMSSGCLQPWTPRTGGRQAGLVGL